MLDNSRHPTAQALALFCRGKLSEAQAATVSRHLKSCADCGRAVANLSSAAARATAPTPAPAPSTLPPELLRHPKFRVLRELGRGRMGIVYLAEHRVMNRPVAIKVISNSLLADNDAPLRFQAEVRAAASLDHQNIVRAFDAERAGGLHLLIMEFVEGPDLATLLKRRGPLPLADACRYAQQAALGLQHAFERGMVHRDIKPQNLMLTSEGVFKILDFGLACARSRQAKGTRLTQQDSFMGTPEYVAPEQAIDAREADNRADTYSLGCTLYALLAGRPPFVEANAVKLVLAHIEKEPMPLRQVRPAVPEALAATVAKMMAKDPAQRYQTPLEAARALAPFCRADARVCLEAVSPAGIAPINGPRIIPPVRKPVVPGPLNGAARSQEAADGRESLPSEGESAEVEPKEEEQSAWDAEPCVQDKSRTGLIAGAIVGTIALLVLACLWLGNRTDPPPVPPKIPPVVPPKTGSLLVRGLQAGDRLYLDEQERFLGPEDVNKEIRFAVPLRQHQVVVKREKHRDWSWEGTVWEGRPEVPVNVKPERLTGKLQVKGLLAGDQVIVDGVVKERSRGVSVQLDVEEGEHQLRVERAGHDPWKQPVVVAAGETTPVEAKPVALGGGLIKPPPPPPATATLVLRVDQPGARVKINGREHNVLTPGDGHDLEVPVAANERLHVTVEKEGFETSPIPPIFLLADKRKEVTVTMTRLPPMEDKDLAQVPALLKKLSDANSKTRIAALESLGKLGPKVKDTAGEAVARCMLDKDNDVGQKATNALESIDRVVAKECATIILDKDHRLRDIETLGKLGKDARSATPILLWVVDNPKEIVGSNPKKPNDVTAAALRALVAIAPDGDRLLPSFLSALGLPDEDVKYAAVAGLPKLEKLSNKKKQEAVADLIIILRKAESPRIRAAAADALGEFGPEAIAAKRDLGSANFDTNEDVRQAAKRALDKISSK